MKSKTIIILISLCFGILSCEQDETENFHCVNTIRNSAATVILSESELGTIKSLFDYNRLDFNKYQFSSLQNDELGYHHIRCNQFVNSLRVFTDDLIFHFDQNDKYYSLSGDIIEKIDLNTKTSMDYDSVVEKFLHLIEQDNTYIGDKKEIINNCFDLEFGYFDLNAGISYSDENFTKAWKIKLTNKDYPYAYINDENSETISYDNGIRY